MNHLKQIQSRLPDFGVEALLITGEVSEAYAVGFQGEGVALVTPGECFYWTDSRYIEAASARITGCAVMQVRQSRPHRACVREQVERLGKRLVLADLDNTIARYRQPVPDEALFAWKRALNQAGITVFILSNGRKPHRSRRFARAFGVDYISHAGKPKGKGFRAALERTGFTAAETVMVGDQIFTDIWGANLAGEQHL